MANLRSSKKKDRKDRKRVVANALYRRRLEESLRVMKDKSSRTPDSIAQAYKLFDKSAKRGVISKRRAARLKSQVSAK